MYELNLMPPLKMYRPGCLVHVVFLSVAHVFGNEMPGGKCFLLSRHAHFQLGDSPHFTASMKMSPY